MNCTIPPRLAPHHWLIVSAWRPELAYFKRHLKRLEKQTSLRFTLAEVGIGLVASAIGTTRAIATLHPDGVLLIGTAGFYPTGRLPPALGSTALIRQVSLLPDLVNGRHAFLPSRVKTTRAIPKQLIAPFARATGIPILDVACPLGITTSASAAKTANRGSGAALENLEAYAVFQAASVASLPFFAIVGIANQVGPEGHRQWLVHGKSAARAACKAAITGFQNLPTTAPIR